MHYKEKYDKGKSIYSPNPYKRKLKDHEIQAHDGIPMNPNHVRPKVYKLVNDSFKNGVYLDVDIYNSIPVNPNIEIPIVYYEKYCKYADKIMSYEKFSEYVARRVIYDLIEIIRRQWMKETPMAFLTLYSRFRYSGFSNTNYFQYNFCRIYFPELIPFIVNPLVLKHQLIKRLRDHSNGTADTIIREAHIKHLLPKKRNIKKKSKDGRDIYVHYQCKTVKGNFMPCEKWDSKTGFCGASVDDDGQSIFEMLDPRNYLVSSAKKASKKMGEKGTEENELVKEVVKNFCDTFVEYVTEAMNPYSIIKTLDSVFRKFVSFITTTFLSVVGKISDFTDVLRAKCAIVYSQIRNYIAAEYGQESKQLELADLAVKMSCGCTSETGALFDLGDPSQEAIDYTVAFLLNSDFEKMEELSYMDGNGRYVTPAMLKYYYLNACDKDEAWKISRFGPAFVRELDQFFQVKWREKRSDAIAIDVTAPGFFDDIQLVYQYILKYDLADIEARNYSCPLVRYLDYSRNDFKFDVEAWKAQGKLIEAVNFVLEDSKSRRYYLSTLGKQFVRYPIFWPESWEDPLYRAFMLSFDVSTITALSQVMWHGPSPTVYRSDDLTLKYLLRNYDFGQIEIWAPEGSKGFFNKLYYEGAIPNDAIHVVPQSNADNAARIIASILGLAAPDSRTYKAIYGVVSNSGFVFDSCYELFKEFMYSRTGDKSWIYDANTIKILEFSRRYLEFVNDVSFERAIVSDRNYQHKFKQLYTDMLNFSANMISASKNTPGMSEFSKMIRVMKELYAQMPDPRYQEDRFKPVWVNLIGKSNEGKSVVTKWLESSLYYYAIGNEPTYVNQNHTQVDTYNYNPLKAYHEGYKGQPVVVAHELMSYVSTQGELGTAKVTGAQELLRFVDAGHMVMDMAFQMKGKVSFCSSFILSNSNLEYEDWKRLGLADPTALINRMVVATVVKHNEIDKIEKVDAGWWFLFPPEGESRDTDRAISLFEEAMGGTTRIPQYEGTRYLDLRGFESMIILLRKYNCSPKGLEAQIGSTTAQYWNERHKELFRNLNVSQIEQVFVPKVDPVTSNLSHDRTFQDDKSVVRTCKCPQENIRYVANQHSTTGYSCNNCKNDVPKIENTGSFWNTLGDMFAEYQCGYKTPIDTIIEQASFTWMKAPIKKNDIINSVIPFIAKYEEICSNAYDGDLRKVRAKAFKELFANAAYSENNEALRSAYLSLYNTLERWDVLTPGAFESMVACSYKDSMYEQDEVYKSVSILRTEMSSDVMDEARAKHNQQSPMHCLDVYFSRFYTYSLGKEYASVNGYPVEYHNYKVMGYLKLFGLWLGIICAALIGISLVATAGGSLYNYCTGMAKPLFGYSQSDQSNTEVNRATARRDLANAYRGVTTTDDIRVILNSGNPSTLGAMTKIMGNLSLLHVIGPDMKAYTANALFVKTGEFVTTGHLFPKGWKQMYFTQLHELKDMKGGLVAYGPSDIEIRDMSGNIDGMTVDTDLILCRIGAGQKMPFGTQFADISCHFAKTIQTEDRELSRVRKIVTGHSITNIIDATKFCAFITNRLLPTIPSKITTPSFIMYGAKGVSGDCGLPYLREQNSRISIDAIHMASDNFSAFAAPISLSMIEAARKDFQVEYQMQEIQVPSFIEETITNNPSKELPGVWSMNDMKNMYIGTGGTTLKESPLRIGAKFMKEKPEFYTECNVAPAIRQEITSNGTKVSPYTYNDEKRVKGNTPPMPDALRALVEEDSDFFFEECVDPNIPIVEPRELELEEVVFKSEYSDGSNTAASLGFLKQYTKFKSCSDMWDKEKQWISPELKKVIEEYRSYGLKGIPLTFSGQALKDELLPVEDIERGKVRSFAVTDKAVYLIVSRLYGHFLNYVKKNPRTPFVYGYNPHNHQAQNLYRRFYREYNRVGAEDASGNDYDSPHYMAWIMCHNIATKYYKYERGSEMYNLMINWGMTVVKFAWIRGKTASWNERGMQSGHPLTSFFNSYKHYYMRKFVFKQIYPLDCFRKAVIYIGHGDDANYNTTKGYEMFNMINVSICMKEYFGMTITSSDKKDNTTAFMSDPMDMEFLSRTFDTLQDKSGTPRVVHKLKKSSIYGMLNYVRTEELSEHEAMQANIKTAQREALYHGKGFFDSLTKDIREASKKKGSHYVVESWEKVHSYWSDNYFNDNYPVDHTRQDFDFYAYC